MTQEPKDMDMHLKPADPAKQNPKLSPEFKQKLLEKTQEEAWQHEADAAYARELVTPKLQTVCDELAAEIAKLNEQIAELEKSHTKADREKKKALLVEQNQKTQRLTLRQNVLKQAQKTEEAEAAKADERWQYYRFVQETF